MKISTSNTNNNTKNENLIPKAEPAKNLQKTSNGILFSFENLDMTEYFNLDGTCQNWALDMLMMCKEISKLTVKQLTSGKMRTFRFHSHENAKCPSQLPKGIALKDIYQMRISASKGGIHGILIENCFYVIWLDPLHNMYPDERYGGLRKVKPASTCCKDRDEEILKLQDELREAQEDTKIWQKLAEEVNTQ